MIINFLGGGSGEGSSLVRAYQGKMDDTIDPQTGVITSGTTGHTALCYIYKYQDNTYGLVKVDIEEIIEEKDFAAGLQVSGHVVSIKIDEASQPNLTVSTAGLKLDGVERVVELTQAEYEALSSYSANTTYVITDAEEINMNNYWTSAQTTSAITDNISSAFTSGKTYVDSALTEYNKTDNFATINSSAITSSATDFDLETVKKLTQAEYEALSSYDPKTTYVITDASATTFITMDEVNSAITSAIGAESARTETTYQKIEDMSAYTPTSGFTTINGSAITTGGNMQIIGEVDEVLNTDSSITITSATTASGKSFTLGVNVDDKTIKIQDGTVAGQYAIKSAATPASSAYSAQYNLSVKDGSIAFGYSDSILIPAQLSAGTNISIDNDLKINLSGMSTINGSAITSGNNIVMTIASATPSSENVREEWILADGAGNAIGEHIKIYKDGSLTDAYLGHVDDTVNETTGTITMGTGATAMGLVYKLATGKYSLILVDVSKFLEETEFSSGLSVDNHVVSVKVDSTSESFLSLSSDGIKLSGVSSAISTAIAAESARCESTYMKGSGLAGLNGDATGLTNSGNTIYAPLSAGTANTPLYSNGSGAPVWGSYKHIYLSQAEYDALAVKSSDTVYFII